MQRTAPAYYKNVMQHTSLRYSQVVAALPEDGPVGVGAPPAGGHDVENGLGGVGGGHGSRQLCALLLCIQVLLVVVVVSLRRNLAEEGACSDRQRVRLTGVTSAA